MIFKDTMMQCPYVSHRKKLVPAYKKGETDFRICTECGIAFREKFPTPSELEEIYKQAYAIEKISSGETNQESGSYAAISYGKFIQSTFCSRDGSVLDYGAGSGQLVEQLRANGINAEGLEYSGNARDYCQEKRGFSLLNNLMNVPDDYFHVISMIEVIEHLTDINSALAELYRITAPDGHLLVTTPNRKGLKARLQKGYWREAQKKFHLFLFDNKSLYFHLRAAGFTDVRRIRFSPVQRTGIIFFLKARLMQLFGVHGTLCVVAKKPYLDNK